MAALDQQQPRRKVIASAEQGTQDDNWSVNELPLQSTKSRSKRQQHEMRYSPKLSLQRFSASDLASLRLSLDLQTPSNATVSGGLQVNEEPSLLISQCIGELRISCC